MDTSKYKAKPHQTIEQHTQELLKRLQFLWDNRYILDKRIYLLCYKACFYHDWGKGIDEFQERVNDETGKLRFNKEKEIAHNILSVCFLKPEDYEPEDYLIIAFAILFHHHYYKSEFEVLLGSKENREKIKQLLSDFSNEIKIPKRSLQSKILAIWDKKESILVKGFLHKCDYCGSAGCEIEIPNHFLEKSLEELLEDWNRAENKPKTKWNEMQNYCREHQEDNIMIIAQTGMGKTEGALQWIGNHKGFFVLPLRTAINAMYQRITREIVKEDIEHRISILHSESLEYLIKEEKTEFDIIEYTTRGRQLAMPLTITTMDQIFDFVYKYPGYEMKLTTFSYAKIVIDEIQMYSADLLACLVYGVEKICEMGGKVAITTATLPPFISDLFHEVNFSKAEFLNEQKRHNVKVIQEKLNSDDIIDLYRKNKSIGKSNKILVICNTIRKAQELFYEIKEQFSDSEEQIVHIFHSRYTRADRLKLEKEIKEVGKTYAEDGTIDCKDEIWISTSLVEASLDIDFDYLFTELQDLNSLFQRMGRCNRKGKKDIQDANCFVYTEIEAGLIKRGNNGFIDEMIYELSKEALLDDEIGFSGVVTEKQKKTLLDKYFRSDNKKIQNSSYMKEYRDAYDMFKELNMYETEKKDIDMRNINSYSIIPLKLYEEKEQYRGNLEEYHKAENYIEKKKILETILEDTVDIPQYEYCNAVKNKKIYTNVRISEYRQIAVINCKYELAGYERKEKSENDILATFW